MVGFDRRPAIIVKILLIKKINFFDYYLYRDVLAGENLLDMPDRVDWKKCKIPKEEETIQAKKFRKRFHPFDFNFS